MPALPEIPAAPEGLEPLDSWVDLFLEWFDQLRQGMEGACAQPDHPEESLPELSDAVGWRSVLVGESVERSELWGARRPTMGLIRTISPRSAAVLLQKHGLWLLEFFGSPAEHECAEWLFGLLCRVDWLLDAPTQSAMRDMLRACCDMRAGLAPAQDESASGVSHLNIVIVIVGYYFGQCEFEDY
eukprot:TRINITY_DN13836_c0_g1_i3.p1 TRINITY_DN13836_c0_g1~~TRINITY_DN13836_c0_g1_i3.p1  ORF type:complete len:185 (+),score=20.85 TRINITY_DN13836_c0_g1_i3:468-1022(+)